MNGSVSDVRLRLTKTVQPKVGSDMEFGMECSDLVVRYIEMPKF